jgi:asparagine synthase (glutamine-hydrolysing)
MPGLIGFYGRFSPNDPAQFLSDMAHALEPDAAYRTDLYQQADVGLGRVTLGILNPEPQPVWNDDKSIAIVMIGELYDTQDLKREMEAGGYPFRLHNDAELMLHLYQEYGEAFAPKLNGAFAAAIWEEPTRTLRIVNDRLGLFPLYYAHGRNGLLFASGVRALLADPNLPRRPDRMGMAQFLIFDHMLHDHTLLQDVKLFPQGSILTCREGQISIRRYWELRYPEEYQLRREEALMEETIHLLRQAVYREAARDDLPAGLLLSGGMDSRALLALLTEKETPLARPLQTFTWGIPGCDDARYAKKLAKLCGVEHYFYELEPDYLLRTADNAVRLTDGLGNIINLHALATLDQEAERVKVIYKGFLGDAMFGFALRYQHWATYDPDTAVQAHFQVHQDQGVINYTWDELDELLTADFRREIGDGVMAEYRQGMLDSGATLLANQRLYFDMRQRVPRMTLNGVEVARSRTAVRLPFADNDLLAFSMTIPPGLQQNRYLIHTAISRAFPALAKVPSTLTGLPMLSNFREIFIRSGNLLRWHLYNRGLSKHAGRVRRPYKDYTNWFRTILRPWVEETLLNDHALQRGYFQPDAVRTLVADHMNGANHTGRIGALMTLELWHKQFMD